MKVMFSDLKDFANLLRHSARVFTKKSPVENSRLDR